MPLTPAFAIDRLTLGSTAELQSTVAHLGVDAWVQDQLAPGAEPPALLAQLRGMQAVTLSPEQLFLRYRPPRGKLRSPEALSEYRKHARMLYIEAASARIQRAYASPWQLRELLVDFWYSHFNVFARKGLCVIWTGSFEQQAIRPHVFGRFSDMLLATARHPAMLFYLDNWRNTDPNSRRARGPFKGLNENYAREVMELHTVGLHYTQADVAGATRLLTGWGLDRRGGFAFDGVRHDDAPQTILGRRFQGGERAVVDFLDFLATHPDTAQHVSRKLAQYFVADQPPDALVTHMRERFLATGGDLRAVTAAMIEHPDFAAAAARRDKFRTPYRYVLGALRAGDVAPNNPLPLIGMLYRLGQPLYGCTTPNGWDNTQAEWLSPDALSARLDFAVALGGGWLPLRQQPGDANAMRAMPRAPATPVALNTVREALGPTLPQSTLDAARRAPRSLRAATVLGSPALQYC